ncbi:hypothetical protein BDV59DRAFT_180807 [Aspergillus ambiguus]|uniref:DUF3433 domain-containing protein n=1 Tax=Aspergillus ambiguus TaxID=176160 RepID=UPI003CCDA523
MGGFGVEVVLGPSLGFPLTARLVLSMFLGNPSDPLMTVIGALLDHHCSAQGFAEKTTPERLGPAASPFSYFSLTAPLNCHLQSLGWSQKDIYIYNFSRKMRAIHRFWRENNRKEAILAGSETIPLANITEDREENAKGDPKPELWTPFFLTKSCLLMFIGTFIGIMVALGALYGSSRQNDGLASANENMHYLWTYGPTAVFTVVAALWGQVDFRTRQLTPWKHMLYGPAASKDTLFLDYIDPWIGQALWNSLQARHFTVSLAITGSLLLRLIIVLSTGLFTSELRHVHLTDIPLQLQNEFDGTGFANASIGWEPYGLVYAVDAYGGKYQFGTTDKYAYQTFLPQKSDMNQNISVTSEVDVFHGELSCQVLLDNAIQNISRKNDVWHSINPFVLDVNSTQLSLRWWDDTTLHYNVTGVTPDCYFEFGDIPVTLPHTIYDDSMVAAVALTSCRDGLPSPLLDTYSEYIIQVPDPKSYDRLDHLLLYANRNYNKTSKFTALLCDVDYSISRANLTVELSPSPVGHLDNSLSSNYPKRKLADISKRDILKGLRLAIKKKPKQVPLNDVFGVMGALTPGLDYDLWMDPGQLKQNAEHFFSSITAQVAAKYLTTSSNHLIHGTGIQSVERLVIQDLSFGLAEGILAILVAIAIAILFHGPRGVCPRDPSTISGLAVIIASSPELQKSFKGTGTWDATTLLSAAATKLYQTGISISPSGRARFSIQDNNRKRLQREPVDDQPGATLKAVEWWRPFSATAAAQSLTFLGPIGIIITLETLLQKSQQFQDITDLKPGSYTNYAWLYLPAGVLFSVSLMYGVLDFGARVFEPYSTLRRRASPARQSIYSQQLGKLGLHSLWNSLVQRQIATAATSISILVGGLLIIAAGGLYTSQSAPVNIPIFATTQLDHKDSSFAADFSQPALTPTLILNGNLSYPQWTTENLVLSSFQIQNASAVTEPDKEYTATFHVPSIRTKANCTALAPDTIQVIKRTDGVRISISMPAWADGLFPLGLPNGTYNRNFPYSYFGYWDWSGVVISGYAHREFANATASALLCIPYYEAVEAEATFDIPSMELNDQRPPHVNEENAVFLVSAGNIAAIFSALLAHADIPESRLYPDTNYDEVFLAMVYGRFGIPPWDLVGDENIGRLHRAFERIFNIVATQQAKIAYFRPPQPPIAAPKTTVNGTLHDPNRHRLMQNGISTRLLEGFLGVMLICAVVAFFAIDTRRTLPKSVTSIGAVLSLLADSDMLGRTFIPPESEWCDDRELQRRGVFDGWLFSMGWWGVGEKRFGIDVGQADP